MSSEWVLPAAIPFETMKGADLEQCVYWLLDAMGAKDLEWRSGGSGGGAADGGRDLEARFYAPGPDGEIEARSWWIECKGRTGTVEPDAVKAAVVNAEARGGLDYVVVATNTQFSNPTRDWLREWQSTRKRPTVKLWDRSQLERMLSRQPDVVLRLYAEALSLEGRLHALESRFWNKLEYTSERSLAGFWDRREETPIPATGVFALIANEFANGDIVSRPWGAAASLDDLVSLLHVALANTAYLVLRSHRAGADDAPIRRAFAYLLLCGLDRLSADDVHRLVEASVYGDRADAMPDDVKKMLLMPMLDQIQSELQDVCSADCERISSLTRNVLTEDDDEVDDYWLRLDPKGRDSPKDRGRLRLERESAPCVVGFAVDKERSCPLFEMEPGLDNVAELLEMLRRVTRFRKAQAAGKREAARS